jgi:hypothetical protein
VSSRIKAEAKANSTFGIAWSGVPSGNAMLSELKLGNICEDARPPVAARLSLPTLCCQHLNIVEAS